MKKLLLLLLVPIFVVGQAKMISLNGGYVTLYGTANDTISNITKQDTLSWRKWIDGQSGSWHDVTGGDAYITAAEKTGETNQEYTMADEDYWTSCQWIEFAINSGDTASVGDILSGQGIVASHLKGAITVIVCPDTSGTNTTYTIKVGGN